MTFIKGKHSVYEALCANANIQYIAIAQTSKHSAQHIINYAKQKKINVSILPSREFEQRYQIKESQHVIAKMGTLKTESLKEFLLKNTQENVIICDHLEDPYNFGAIMRTCEGLGLKNIIYPKNRHSKMNEGVIKASSGAIYHLNLIEVSNISNTVQELKRHHYWIYGADSKKGTSIHDIETLTPLALLVGNEHKGLSPNLTKHLDIHLKIPMKGKIDSFNVSAATAITLFKLLSQ